MVATGKFITTFPRSVLDLYADRFGLKVLPVELPNSNWPVKIATLRNRMLWRTSFSETADSGSSKERSR
jgi:hypothetical protein